MTIKKNDLWTVVTPREEIVLKILSVKDTWQEPTLEPPNFPVVWQRDERWRDLLLGDLGRGTTIGNAGCALCCLTAWLQWKYRAPYDALLVRLALHAKRLLVGPDHTMMDWRTLCEQWGKATFDSRCWQDWYSRPADLMRLDVWLQNGPVIVETDFKSATARVDQHFVVAIDWIENDIPLFKRRLWVMDPWEGAVVALPPAYYDERWNGTIVVRNCGKVARIITGARAIGHAGEVP